MKNEKHLKLEEANNEEKNTSRKMLTMIESMSEMKTQTLT